MFSLVVGLVQGWAAALPGLSYEEQDEWRKKVGHQILILDAEVKKADCADRNKFSCQEPAVPTQIVKEILSFYPPEEGGLYPHHYRKEVDQTLYHRAHRMGIWGEKEVNWDSPWYQISSEVLGAWDPFDVIPHPIALIEIRKLPSFKGLGQLYLDRVKEPLAMESIAQGMDHLHLGQLSASWATIGQLRGLNSKCSQDVYHPLSF